MLPHFRKKKNFRTQDMQLLKRNEKKKRKEKRGIKNGKSKENNK